MDPIKINIRYCRALREITGTDSEPAIVNRGMPFVLFLSTIFSSYPEIEKQFPAGTLGFAVNGKPPPDFTIMEDGDVVEFTVVLRN